MNSSRKALNSEWHIIKIAEILERAEEAEYNISYTTPCKSEHSRRLTGSYYTPIDVSRFFWNEFFQLRNINTPNAARRFISGHIFIEPSVGAGSLFFAFIEKLLLVGLDPSDLSSIRFDLVDLNSKALGFVKNMVLDLSREGPFKLNNINYLHSNFLNYHNYVESGPVVIFGNPPFVNNKRGLSNWKNRFADFLERSIQIAGGTGSIQLVVPLSLAFSRDYVKLRQLLLAEERIVALSNFDNVPDTLFKSGKPNQFNTNKANSQRCTIVTSFPSYRRKILSTSLKRWSRRDRSEVLSTSPEYVDVTNYQFNEQIPRPQNVHVLKYLQVSGKCTRRVCNHVNREGYYAFHVSGVARNFVGIREQSSPSVNTLKFSNISEFYRIFVVLISDLFYDYWLTVGDGFHVTRSNIMNFPIHERLLEGIDSSLLPASILWKTRKRFNKCKLNSGMFTQSYDFSSAAISLYPWIEDIVSPAC